MGVEIPKFSIIKSLGEGLLSCFQMVPLAPMFLFKCIKVEASYLMGKTKTLESDRSGFSADPTLSRETWDKGL